MAQSGKKFEANPVDILSRLQKPNPKERVISLKEYFYLFDQDKPDQKMNEVVQRLVHGELVSTAYDFIRIDTPSPQSEVLAYIEMKSLKPFEDLTLLDVCKYSKKIGDRMVCGIITLFFLLVGEIRESAQQIKFMIPFVSVDYQQLKAVCSLEVIQALFKFPFPYIKKIQPIPKLITDYAKDILNQIIADDPEAFASLPDFAEAINNTKYKMMPGGGYSDRRCVEGYWLDNKREEEAYEFADRHREVAFTPETKMKFLEALQNIYKKNKVVLSDDFRLPYPELKPWKGQETVIAVLENLERMAKLYSPHTGDTYCSLSTLFSSIIPENRIRELMNYLLPFRLEYIPAGGDGAIMRLPPLRSGDPFMGGAEFKVSIGDGTYLRWTVALKEYIRYYNVIPSREFLNKISCFINNYKVHFKNIGLVGLRQLAAANSLDSNEAKKSAVTNIHAKFQPVPTSSIHQAGANANAAPKETLKPQNG